MSLIIYLRTKNIYKLIIFAVITISQSLIVNFIQIVIQRPRPFVISDIVYLGSNIPTAFSFPSGHTTFAFFLAYLATHIFQLSKVQTVIVYLIALLIAFSRLYLGAHYILDIVGGMLLGTLLAMVTFKIYLKIV